MTSQTLQDTLADQLFDESRRRLSSLGLPERLLDDPDPTRLDETWHAVAAAGWFRTLVEEQDDGLGLGLHELGAVFRAVGHSPLRGPLLDQAVAVPLLLARAGGRVRERLLLSLDGESVTVLAEDPTAPYGRGVEAVHLVDAQLDGQIALVPFVELADHFVVVASSAEGPALVMVDAADVVVKPGSSADPCVAYGSLLLRGVPVEQESVIATGPNAAALRERIRGALRLMAVAELSGATAELTALAVAYAKTRHQFGRPIGGFQAVRHLLAEMQGRTSSLRSLADACLTDADSDEHRWAELGRAAKAYSTEPARFVAEQSLQIHGGMGFTYEMTPHLYLRRVLTLEGYLGEAADMLVEIGQEETR